MSNFHSIVSRRDFMKALGLAGAGGVGVLGTSPVFHDLDELASSGNDIQKHPWYVKEREYGDSTTPIDWPNVHRYDRTRLPLRSTFADEEERKVLIEYAQKEDPGWDPGPEGIGDMRTTALGVGAGMFAFGVMIHDDGKTSNLNTLLGRPSVIPLHGETPRWEGTPEDNLKLLRAAVRFYGGSEVGAIDLDENTKKLIWEKTTPGETCIGTAASMGQILDGVTGPLPLVYEDVDQSYMADDKLVISNKCKWVLTWTFRQPEDMVRRMQGVTENAAVFISYSRIAIIELRIQAFLRTLGYQGLGGGTGEWGPSGAFATLTGLGELGRASYIITPKYGISVRGMNRMLTDFPLAPTKPIDAGMRKFCYTCGICADACPFGAIQTGDPSFEGYKPWMNNGYEAWRVNYENCTHCPVCQGTCPFNELGGSMLHGIIKGTVATTPVFNSFFRNMHKVFDYGRKPTRDWWDLDNQPEWGFDSTR
ncbi:MULTISPECIES: reductive dehalogenase [Dehalococcoides]|uniref:reductive dehalogenase n=1 Tax=Dehalococcoides TaxID=61434 RepID=UPI0002B7737F|nr:MULTISPECIES: reductive dehalogenase [Dehalococcoides]AGG06956.1 reductive dehalogenase [Dehalococcoides mccartyi DCMB5]